MAAIPSPFKSQSGRGNLQKKSTNIQSTFDTPNSIVKLNRKINLLSSTLTVYHKISLGLVAFLENFPTEPNPCMKFNSS